MSFLSVILLTVAAMLTISGFCLMVCASSIVKHSDKEIIDDLSRDLRRELDEIDGRR